MLNSNISQDSNSELNLIQELNQTDNQIPVETQMETIEAETVEAETLEVNNLLPSTRPNAPILKNKKENNETYKVTPRQRWFSLVSFGEGNDKEYYQLPSYPEIFINIPIEFPGVIDTTLTNVPIWKSFTRSTLIALQEAGYVTLTVKEVKHEISSKTYRVNENTKFTSEVSPFYKKAKLTPPVPKTEQESPGFSIDTVNVVQEDPGLTEYPILSVSYNLDIELCPSLKARLQGLLSFTNVTEEDWDKLSPEVQEQFSDFELSELKKINRDKDFLDVHDLIQNWLLVTVFSTKTHKANKYSYTPVINTKVKDTSTNTSTNTDTESTDTLESVAEDKSFFNRGKKTYHSIKPFQEVYSLTGLNPDYLYLQAEQGFDVWYKRKTGTLNYIPESVTVQDESVSDEEVIQEVIQEELINSYL